VIWLCIDAGSSLTKAALLAYRGVQIAKTGQRVDLDRGADGRVEMDSDAAWQALASVLRKLMAESAVCPRHRNQEIGQAH
jgi:sugar (pentulose or hexulose) kinase